MFKSDLRYLVYKLKKEKLSIIIGASLGLVASLPIIYDTIITSNQNNIVNAVNFTEVEELQSISTTIVLPIPASSANVLTVNLVEKSSSLNATTYDDKDLIAIDENRIEKEAEERKKEEEQRKKEEIIKKKKQQAEAEIKFCEDAELNVPNWSTGCKSSKKTYMPYTAVTSKSSDQYKLLNSTEAYTDEVSGIRMVDGRYCIAVGTAYCSKIGTKINLVMHDGSIVKCILGDVKANQHTDATKRFHSVDGSVVEFIVDYSIFKKVRDNSGTVNFVDGLDGDILKVVVLP